MKLPLLFLPVGESRLYLLTLASPKGEGRVFHIKVIHTTSFCSRATAITFVSFLLSSSCFNQTRHNYKQKSAQSYITINLGLMLDTRTFFHSKRILNIASGEKKPTKIPYIFADLLRTFLRFSDSLVFQHFPFKTMQHFKVKQLAMCMETLLLKTLYKGMNKLK